MQNMLYSYTGNNIVESEVVASYLLIYRGIIYLNIASNFNVKARDEATAYFDRDFSLGSQEARNYSLYYNTIKYWWLYLSVLS